MQKTSHVSDGHTQLSYHKMKNVSITHLCKLLYYNHGTLYGTECQLQCIGNDCGNARILQSLQHVCPTGAHIVTERTPYVHLSGPTEPM